MTVSVKDVAAAAGVSVGTVSNVLNRPEQVSKATAERVHRAIDELGFVRNDAARQLRAGQSRSIGLVVPDVGNPFFAEVARGAEERAAEAGMTVLLGNSDEQLDRQTAHLELFREQRLSGVLVAPVSDDLSVVRQLASSGTRAILVDHEDAESSLPGVAVDDVEGGRLAVAHLLRQGSRKVAYVSGPAQTRQVADRLRGARAAIDAVPGATLEIIERPALTVLHGRTAGEEIVARSPALRPEAVFAANDLLAVGLLQAFALGGGVQVPNEIALIGYDDIDFASATVVSLSSISQPARTLGRTAVDLLLEEGDSPKGTVRFQPELVVRDSTAG